MHEITLKWIFFSNNCYCHNKKKPTYINSVKLPFILLKISDSHAYL